MYCLTRREDIRPLRKNAISGYVYVDLETFCGVEDATYFPIGKLEEYELHGVYLTEDISNEVCPVCALRALELGIVFDEVIEE